TSAPSPSLSSPPNSSSTNDATPALAGSAGTAAGDSTNVTVKLYAGASATGVPLQTLSTTRSGGGSFSVDASPALGEGTYTARAEQSDAAGNSGTGAPTTFIVDTIPPSLRLDTPADASSTNDTTPTFAGSADTPLGDSSNVTVKLYAGANPIGTPVQTLSATRSAGGPFSIDASSALT